uniref:Uncharacterized protein n=1 Tax=Oryza sativa subsp. indica TaxID=39946 RepID=A0A8F3ADL3_ORYSI|nr:hypothetical protein Xa7_IRBB7.25 [Oryza sativa Indica Group]
MEKKADPERSRNHDGAAPAAGAGAEDGRFAPPAPPHQLELHDRRLRAAAFLMACGCSVVLYGTAVNPSAVNGEHILVGFLLLVAGAALAILTLGGAGRTADRLVAAVRAFFQI